MSEPRSIERFVYSLHFDACLAIEFGWSTLWHFDAGTIEQRVGVGIEWMRAAAYLTEIYEPVRAMGRLARAPRRGPAM